MTLEDVTARLPTITDPIDPGLNRTLWQVWQNGLTMPFTLPEDLPPLRVLLVWDNLAGHKTPEMVGWLCRHGIMPLYTPLGGSWLNTAEAIQRILKRRALDGQYLTSPAEIGTWFAQTAHAWNQRPTPFIWNGKRRKRRRNRPGDGHPVGGSAAFTLRPISHSAKPVRMLKLIPNDPLGRVDGFDDDEAQSECDEGSEVPVRFLATERNALEALELADEVFDAGAGAIERLREERRPSLGRCLERDHRADAALARGRAIDFGIIAFITHGRARRDVGSEVEQDLELRAVAGLTFREVKSEGAPIQISLEVDLGRETAAGAAQRLTILPPFGACGRDVGPHDGGVEHLNQVGRLAHRREGVEEGLEHARLAQAPEALPH